MGDSTRKKVKSHPKSEMEMLKRLLSSFTRQPLQEDEEKGETEFAREITVDRQTMQPSSAWKTRKQKPQKLKVDLPTSPPSPDSLRFVCISDTHGLVEEKQRFIDSIPEGDVLLHAGDFTMFGEHHQVVHFNELLGKLPHPVKLVIPGNHDVTFEKRVMTGANAATRRKFLRSVEGMEEELEKASLKRAGDLLTNATLLLDSGVTVCGVKVYGSPWVPSFGKWGFSLPRGQLMLDRWSWIPTDTDILMTHGPPLGHGDYVFDGRNVGCVDLLNTVQRRVKPKYHVFGHIHEGHGVYMDGTTTYINAAVCTVRYKPSQRPIVFDYPLPPGHTKEELLRPLTGPQQDSAEAAAAAGGEAACSAAADDDQSDDEDEELNEESDDYGDEEEEDDCDEDEDEDEDFVQFLEPSDVV